MAAAKTFWISFLDGLTGDGIFGDLRLPGAPTRLFKDNPQEVAVRQATQVPGLDEIARRVTGNISVVGVGSVPSGFFGGRGYDVDAAFAAKDSQAQPLAVRGVYVDVNGEIINIAHDREKGWIVVSDPTTRAAR